MKRLDNVTKTWNLKWETLGTERKYIVLPDAVIDLLGKGIDNFISIKSLNFFKKLHTDSYFLNTKEKISYLNAKRH